MEGWRVVIRAPKGRALSESSRALSQSDTNTVEVGPTVPIDPYFAGGVGRWLPSPAMSPLWGGLLLGESSQDLADPVYSSLRTVSQGPVPWLQVPARH